MKIALLLVTIIACVHFAGAQIIGARAGLVKKITGEVFVHCHQGALDKSKLQLGEMLHNEDLVFTGGTGFAVLALNPDSYMLVYGNTTLRVKDTALDSMHFDVVTGEVILKIADLKNGTSLLVHPPPANVKILKNGLYRVFVEGDGKTRVNVVSGEATYPDDKARSARLKKGGRVDFTLRSK